MSFQSIRKYLLSRNPLNCFWSAEIYKYGKKHFNLREKAIQSSKGKKIIKTAEQLIWFNEIETQNASNYFRRFELYFTKNNSIPTNTYCGWIFILACITWSVLVLIDLVCLLNWCIVWNPFKTNTYRYMQMITDKWIIAELLKNSCFLKRTHPNFNLCAFKSNVFTFLPRNPIIRTHLNIKLIWRIFLS